MILWENKITAILAEFNDRIMDLQAVTNSVIQLTTTNVQLTIRINTLTTIIPAGVAAIPGGGTSQQVEVFADP